MTRAQGKHREFSLNQSVATLGTNLGVNLLPETKYIYFVPRKVSGRSSFPPSMILGGGAASP